MLDIAMSYGQEYCDEYQDLQPLTQEEARFALKVLEAEEEMRALYLNRAMNAAQLFKN